MIIGFIGSMGSGKTLSATKFAYDYYRQGRTIYANYGLNFEHKKLTLKEIMSMSSDLQNAIILIDEIHIFIDSRESMRKRNKIISYFITQSRKRNLVLIYTTQQLHQIDKRLRTNTNFFSKCTKKVSGDQVFIRNRVVSDDDKHKSFILHANPIFNLYDTHQIIDPMEGMV